MRKMLDVVLIFACCGSILMTVAICRSETVNHDGSSDPSTLVGRGSSWTDQFGETTYTIAAPDTVTIGDTVHVSVIATDPFYPDDMVAAPWNFLVDGGNEDSGFWVSLSDTTWEASYAFVYDAEGSHAFLFTAQDLGHGNGAHGWEWFEIDTATLVVDEVSGLDGVADDPVGFGLSASFPNPFDVSTIIHYQLPEAADVEVQIYDVSGRRVRVLIERASKEAGSHVVHWDGTDDAGWRVGTGVYFYRLQAGPMTRIRRVVLLR